MMRDFSEIRLGPKIRYDVVKDPVAPFEVVPGSFTRTRRMVKQGRQRNFNIAQAFESRSARK